MITKKRASRAAYMRNYFKTRPEQYAKMRERVRKWGRENKERLRAHQYFYLVKRLYGIDKTIYQAMLDQQGGVCAICKQPEYKIGKRYLSVDHSHDTGLVRGLLCDSCNNLLGRANDDPKILRSAIEYLGG